MVEVVDEGTVVDDEVVTEVLIYCYSEMEK